MEILRIISFRVFALLLLLGTSTVDAQNPIIRSAYRILTDSAVGTNVGNHVNMDLPGFTFVVGRFRNGTVDLDFGPGTSTFSNAPYYDASYLAKYTNTGNLVWAKKIGGQNEVNIFDIEVNSIGEIYLAGSFIRYPLNEPDFDPGPAIYNLPFSGGKDCFLVKYDANGDFVWATNYGGGGRDDFYDIELDSQEHIYVAGQLMMQGGAYCGSVVSSAIYGDPFIGKYTSSGSCIWAHSLIVPAFGYGLDPARAIELAGNSVYLAGVFPSSIDLDPGPGVNTRTSNGSTDVFFVKFDTTGNFQDAFTLGGSGTDYVYDLEKDAAGNIYMLVSGIGGSIDFDPGPGVTSLTPSTAKNAVLAKYSPQMQLIWARQIDGDENALYEFEIGPDGTSYCIGYMNGNIDADGGLGVFPLTAANENAFVCSYDSAGTFQFAFLLESNVASRGLGIDCYDPCLLAVTGGFYNSVDADPSAANLALTTPYAGECGFLAFYDLQSCGIFPTSTFSLNAKLINESRVELNWEFAGAEEFVFFVERSANGIEWNALKAYSNIAQHFALDEKPIGNQSFYRVKARNAEGLEIVSSIEFVVLRTNFEPWLLPSIASEEISISSNANWKGEAFFVVDISGKLILNGKLEGEETRIKLGNLAKGKYFVRFPSQRKTLSFLKL